MAAEHYELRRISESLDAFIQQAFKQNGFLADESLIVSEASSSSSASSWRAAKPSLKGKEKENESKGLFAIMEVIDKLVVLEDALDGIKTRVDDKQWTRDATQSLDIDKRLPRDDVRFQSTQMLCRCLTRLASVYHAIETKLEDKRALSQSLLADLASQVAEIMQQHQYMLSPDPIDSLPKPSSYFHDVEQAFNLKLVETLRQANLLTGIDTQKKAEKLLFHCKNLYSVLRPARTVVTVTKAQRQNGEPIYLKSTHRPMTKKTAAQHEAFEDLLKVHSSSTRAEKTLHRNMPIAMQEISKIFQPLITSDNTLLTAQARKFFSHGEKNAFDVQEVLYKENPLEVDGKEAKVCKTQKGADLTLRYKRSGSPAPTADVSSAEMEAAAKENILQAQSSLIQEGELKPWLFVINLLTKIPYQHQNKVVETELRLVKSSKTNEFRDDDTESQKLEKVAIVVLPTGPHGILRTPIVSEDASTVFGVDLGNLPNRSKNIAVKMVSETAIKVLRNSKEKVEILLHCASGQDRTHTAVLRLLGDWFGPYLSREFTDVEPGSGAGFVPNYQQAIVRLLILGNTGPFINSILVPGTPGLKSDSKATHILPMLSAPLLDAVLSQVYTEPAKLNKENPLSKSVESDVLLKREGGKDGFLNAIKAHLDEVTSQELDKSLFRHWLALRDAALQAATGRFSDKEAKSLRDGIYRIVMLFKPYLTQAATPDDLAFIASELCDIAKTFRKEYYRPAINTLGIVVMSVGIALAAAALASLCLAFIPGSPLLLALGISASLLAKVSLIGAAAGLVATGIGAGVFGGERSLRFHNHFSSTLEKQANIIAPQKPKPVDNVPESEPSDDKEPDIAPAQ